MQSQKILAGAAQQQRFSSLALPKHKQQVKAQQHRLRPCKAATMEKEPAAATTTAKSNIGLVGLAVMGQASVCLN